MNLILCGMMGCGKTTIGRNLAEKTNKKRYDTDEIIVEKYGNIADIFTQKGETYFRQIETEIVRDLVKKDGLIISVGGGLVLKDENVALLKNGGKIVYLRAEKQTLFNRLQKDTQRPLLQSAEGLSTRLDELLKTRSPIYERVADCIIVVDGKTPDEITTEIVAWAESK